MKNTMSSLFSLFAGVLRECNNQMKHPGERNKHERNKHERNKLFSF
jgi:hypothetical protein